MRQLLVTVVLFVSLNGMTSAQQARQLNSVGGKAAATSNNPQPLPYYFRAVCKYGGMPFTYPNGGLFYCSKFNLCPQLDRYKCQDLYSDSYGICCPHFGDYSDAYKQQIMYNLLSQQQKPQGQRRMGGANPKRDPMMRGFQSLLGGAMMFNEEMLPVRRLAAMGHGGNVPF